ncbi:hypothetical protein [Bizionia sp.]|uniref:hypothetical protein n=1 Tax=Bizionia sp. TaxID=1954480 RepID=UPI003A94B901
MKTIKTITLLTIICLLTPVVLTAQNQAYWIHADQVKPSKQTNYEQITKDFIAACKKHDLKNADWVTARTDDGMYLNIMPIANMADLDKNPLAPLMEKMGEKNFQAVFENFDTCYDNHGDYILYLMKDLSYMPNGLTTNTPEQNYRKWHYFHVTPANEQALYEKIKEIKALYEKKSSKEYYRIYRSGFGTMGTFYIASISAKDEQTYSKTSTENNSLLGNEGTKLFAEIYVLLEKYEVKSGRMRTDLSYTAKK